MKRDNFTVSSFWICWFLSQETPWWARKNGNEFSVHGKEVLRGHFSTIQYNYSWWNVQCYIHCGRNCQKGRFSFWEFDLDMLYTYVSVFRQSLDFENNYLYIMLMNVGVLLSLAFYILKPFYLNPLIFWQFFLGQIQIEIKSFDCAFSLTWTFNSYHFIGVNLFNRKQFRETILIREKT